MSDTELSTQGDIDGDGRPDLVLVDRGSGGVRIGYQLVPDVFTWSEARATGAADVTGLSVGRVLATNPATRPDMRDAAHALFARDGKAVSVIKDSGGFVTQRVVGCIVNIASDICQQGICSPQDLETGVTLGLGYPMGPLAMGDQVGPTSVLEILFNLQTVYGDPRYRPSPWLRRRTC
jgi:hypothetical protein